MKKINFISLLQFIASGLLLSSFSLEFFFNVAVCHLCIAQRSLWVFLIFITTFLKNKPVILLVIFTSILVSSYHILLQYNVIQDSQVCSISFSVTNAPIAPCNQKDFELFGLTLPAYNLIINIMLFIFISIKMNNTKKDLQNDEFFKNKNI